MIFGSVNKLNKTDELVLQTACNMVRNSSENDISSEVYNCLKEQIDEPELDSSLRRLDEYRYIRPMTLSKGSVIQTFQLLDSIIAKYRKPDNIT